MHVTSSVGWVLGTFSVWGKLLALWTSVGPGVGTPGDVSLPWFSGPPERDHRPSRTHPRDMTCQGE